MNKIKDFLSKYDSALEAVSQDAETAGLLACQAVGKQVRQLRWADVWVVTHNNNPERIQKVVKSRDFIHELEKAVIEKVGDADILGNHLKEIVLKTTYLDNDWRFSVAMAFADAKTRLAACLLALSEVEL